MPATKVNENAELVLGSNVAEPVEPPAPNVVEALRRVMRDLPAIGKDQKASPQQGGYAYRGIEQITVEAQPLLVRHGVVFVPEVVDMQIREVEVGGKAWTDTILQVRYHVYGPGARSLDVDSKYQVEDRITVGPLVGIGRDGADKGANKAMTQAFKYALLQVLCISDAKDDADGTTHEADRYSQIARAGPPRGPDEEPTAAGNTRRGPRVLEGWADALEQRAAHDAYIERGKSELTDPQREQLKAWTAEHQIGWPMTAEQMTAAVGELERIVAQGGEEPF